MAKRLYSRQALPRFIRPKFATPVVRHLRLPRPLRIHLTFHIFRIEPFVQTTLVLSFPPLFGTVLSPVVHSYDYFLIEDTLSWFASLLLVCGLYSENLVWSYPHSHHLHHRDQTLLDSPVLSLSLYKEFLSHKPVARLSALH